MAASESTPLKDLDLTRDEIKRIEDAFKKEEFRKLFMEYAQEISDPENRALYEEEIRKMENERGMNVKFINPTPGYVFKTVISGTETKAFVNICTNENVDKPSCKSEAQDDGRRGLLWSIPHSFAPPRVDFDQQKKKCQVFDVVFHPDTLHMSSSNNAFKNMIEGTAVDGIEKQFSITLDKNAIKYLKMKFKGNPQPTVIRTKSDNPLQPVPEDDILKNFPYPYDNKTTEEKTRENEEKQKDIKIMKESEEKKKVEMKGPTTPKYSIVHQSEVDYQSFTNAPNEAPQSMQPKNLIITVELPLLHSAKTIDLDVFERNLTLKCEQPAKYFLEINLPYAIDDNSSNAKFDKAKHHLVLTLPVIQDKIVPFMSEAGDTLETESPLIECLDSHFTTSDQPDSEPLNAESLDAITLASETEKESAVESVNEQDDFEIDQKDIWPQEMKARIKYLFPEYDCQQDNETISLTARVKNVCEESFTRSYSIMGSRQISSFKFVSLGAGGFPVHYCMVVRMAEGLAIAPEQTMVDFKDDDVCIVLLKSKESREHLWGSIEIGVDADSLKEKTFPTEETLKHEYDALVALCQSEKTEYLLENDRVPPLVNVDDEGNNKKFMIQIGSPDVNDDIEELDWEADTEDHDALSNKIEVIHKHKPPNLHGILKQRSVSESSVDDSLGRVSRENSSEASIDASPRSHESDDPERLKRSVSFSEHIDTTTFKSNASVTSMTVTLKSKRRRQRKRERRQQSQRQRHHSTGSEYSSDDYDHRSAGSEHSDVDEAFVRPTFVTAAEVKPARFEEDLVEEKNKVNRDKDNVPNMGACDDSKGSPEDSDELSEAETDYKTERRNETETETDAPRSDSILSWEDSADTDPEHRTQCAFQFSNSVMFDLDVE